MTAGSQNAEGKDEVLISGRGITKVIGEVRVLANVSLTVRRGEVVTLIGPNGAGKSMLLRILMGIERADAGETYRRDGLVIGYIPQHLSVDPTLPITVRRFLALGCRDIDRIGPALDEVGAAPTMDKPVQSLSGGEFRRVMLARAMLRRPDLLVLDEPLAGVDMAGQVELYRLIGGLRRRYGVGILMVSHDLRLVMAATDEVVCLNHHVCCAGHPESVSRDPAFVALFGGTAADAVAVYTHEHDHVHDLSGGVVPLDEGDAPGARHGHHDHDGRREPHTAGAGQDE